VRWARDDGTIDRAQSNASDAGSEELDHGAVAGFEQSLADKGSAKMMYEGVR